VLVLFLDTATEACVAALCAVEPLGSRGSGTPAAAEVTTLAARAPVDARRHGELLTPLLGEVLDEAGCRAADLDAVVVGLGPGPFTSLRVGVVTAASLADALGIRAIGICTLDAIAAAQPPAPRGSVVVATDALRREVYWARSEGGRPTEGPEVQRPDALIDGWRDADSGTGAVRVVGSGAALYADVFGALADPDAPRWPDPAGGVRVALPDLLADEQPGPLVPLYLRRPDAVPPAAPKPAARMPADR